MQFTWNERKRRVNFNKHGIDFADAPKIFRGLTFTAEDLPTTYAEPRFPTLELLGDRVVSIAHTEREQEIRIISIRKASKHEAHLYFTQTPY